MKRTVLSAFLIATTLFSHNILASESTPKANERGIPEKVERTMLEGLSSIPDDVMEKHLVHVSYEVTEYVSQYKVRWDAEDRVFHDYQGTSTVVSGSLSYMLNDSTCLRVSNIVQWQDPISLGGRAVIQQPIVVKKAESYGC